MSATVGAEAQRVFEDRFVSVGQLSGVVPDDTLRTVRLAAMFTYVAALLWWFRYEGMIWERITVAIALGLFLLCAFVGRPLRDWRILAVDVVCYCALWYSYETTRGAADGTLFGIRFPLQIDAPRNIDKFLFFGNDPNVVLQQHFWQHTIHWYDKVASVIYYTHFIVAPIAMGVLWATSHRQWVRFMKRFATLIGVGCLMFILMPTAPPWMAANTFKIIDPLTRATGRGFSAVGFTAFTHGWHQSLDWGNAVAAMPSLHAGFALMVPAFFLPRVHSTWLKALVMVYPVAMLASLVYLAEHWVIDGLVGWAIVGGSFWFWGWHEQRQRERRAAAALHAAGSGV